MPDTRAARRLLMIALAGVLGLAALTGCGSSGSASSGGAGGGAASYPAVLQSPVVVAGKAAPTTVDIYEDFLCPVCGKFESDMGSSIAKAIGDGKIQVRYHPIAILNRGTNPPGYSQRAASAGMCAAESGFFPAYHEKLFAEQPSENSAGLTDQELVAKGTEIGAPAAFAGCVTSHKYLKAAGTETQRAVKDPTLQQDGGFGTPTVTVDKKRVEKPFDESWLDAITKAG